MNREEILEKVEEIFQDVLDQDDLSLKESDTPNEVEDWDSIANVDIIVAVEGEFDLSFGIERVQNIKSVKDIIDLVQELA